MTPAPVDVAAPLLAWYDVHARDLPWRRKEPDAYGVLVSEFMLQQTQVATVIPYWHRFMSRFPTPSALARASEDEVLKAWEGLGYYGRARRLHRAAQEILQRHGGRIPDQVEDLRRLPGVGDYTAAAVASIAFGRPVAALDGNVLRVLARLYGVEEPVDTSAGRRRLASLAAGLVPADRPGDFNQALMELGALICTPRRPQCERCPLAFACVALARGSAQSLPVRRRDGRAVPQVPVAVAVVVDRREMGQPGQEGSRFDGAVRILAVRRPAEGLLGGLWALPALEGTEARVHPGREVLEEFLVSAGLACRVQEQPFGRWEHVFSHRRWRLEAFLAWPQGEDAPDEAVEEWPRRLAKRLGLGAGDALWVRKEGWAQLALPRPFQRVLEGLQQRVRMGGPQQDPLPGWSKSWDKPKNH